MTERDPDVFTPILEPGGRNIVRFAAAVNCTFVNVGSEPFCSGAGHRGRFPRCPKTTARSLGWQAYTDRKAMPCVRPPHHTSLELPLTS
jgi:hypothetical protein